MEFVNISEKPLDLEILKSNEKSTSNLKSTSENSIIDYNLKYSELNSPRQCIMTNSTCYLETTSIIPKGIMVHSTGINNPYLKRYVQPSKSDENYNTLITDIGINTVGNDFNHSFQKEGYNAWIGKLADGTVTSLQTMPWNFRSYGAGFGINGTCDDNWIQIIICEDELNDGTYFTQVYNELCQLIAYLCIKYKINPLDYVTINNQTIPTILSHQECGDLGMGTKYIDVKHWFDIYHKTMGNVKFDVRRLMKTKENPLSGLKGSASYLVIQPPLFEPYKAKITAKKINIRSDSSLEANIIKTLKKGQIVEILEEKDNWGRIESGWINLKYTSKESED